MASLKTLKIKRIFAWTTYNNLRQTPPKEFPTMDEMRTTLSDILPELKEHVTEYLSLAKEAEALAEKVKSKTLKEEEQKEAVEAINEKFRTYNKEHSGDVIEIKVHKDTMATLVSQFNRWGKNWVVNIEEFGELDKAFTEANK